MMKPNKPVPLSKQFPSSVLAFFTLIVATIVLFGVGEALGKTDLSSYLAYILNYLIIATGCFFIIRANPKSLFYVLTICNALTILAVFVEPSFWKGEMWVINCGGWFFTIIVSLIAMELGNRSIRVDNIKE